MILFCHDDHALHNPPSTRPHRKQKAFINNIDICDDLLDYESNPENKKKRTQNKTIINNKYLKDQPMTIQKKRSLAADRLKT